MDYGAVARALDGQGSCEEAASTLMGIKGIGISQASKLIGLINQEDLCIYDSRVGNAVSSLKHKGLKIPRCPPGQGFTGCRDHTTDRGWAADYERLCWSLQLIRDQLVNRFPSLRVADLEISLFVIGSPS